MKKEKNDKKDFKNPLQNPEILMQFSLFEERAKKIEEQIRMIEQKVFNFELLKQSVKDFSENKEENFLTSLGNGIFVPAKTTNQEDFFVGVGCDIIVKKNKGQTEELISKQISKLKEIKKNLLNELDSISKEIQDLIKKTGKKE